MAESLQSSSAADRNLLFGVLALQTGFISREQLRATVCAWALDKSQTFAEILVGQQALTADARALLEPLVDAQITQHSGDAGKSLAALHSPMEIEQWLAQMDGRDAATAHWPAATAMPDSSPAAHPAPPGVSRFRILRPHAKGGLGEVFVANDEELNREVALKEIQAQYAFQPEHRARFLMEAEITGSLEHPGIVPVYGLGSYADGRPYYAMRFIKGESLQEAIRQFHEKDEVKRDAQERSLALRELLGRFVDVCQAIAYAHSRGVLHRDLKPGNVMLGNYGETLVVDWGLAKTLALAPLAKDDHASPAEPAALLGVAEAPTLLGEAQARKTAAVAPGAAETAVPATPVAERPITPRFSNSKELATQMGQAIGTPAYMSPEQAAGRLDQLGPASDVYSLGATLYHLLTGRPPFEEPDMGLRLTLVQLGEFPRPRAIKPAVPAGLEAVCLRAMGLLPADRYGSAQELAAEVERWLADEPVHAYPEPWTVRSRRWLGRHRVATASAAVAAVMAFAGLGIVLVLTKASEEKERTLRGQERTALELAKQNLELAREAERQEIRQQKRAQARLEKGVEAVERMVSRVTGEKWANRPELESERRESLEEAILFFKELGSEESHDPTVRRQAARAYLQCGNVQAALGYYAKSVASAQTALELYQGLVDQFPSDVTPREGLIETTILLGALASLEARYQEAIAKFEQAVLLADEAVRIDPEGEGALLAQGEALVSLARIQTINDSSKSQQTYAKAEAITEKLMARPKPSFRARLQAAVCLANQGTVEMSQGRNEVGNATFEKARAILAPMEEMPAPNAQSAAMLAQIRASIDVYRGVYLCIKGKREEGLAIIKQGIERLRRLRDLAPGSFSYQFLTMQHLIIYGLELTHQGKGDEAATVFQEVDQIRSKLLAELPQMVWLANFGDLQKSALLIWKAQKGRIAGIEAEMNVLVKRSDARTKQSLQYNHACLFARLAESGPTGDRERHALEAVKRLNDLLNGNFFEQPINRDHLDDDPDLVSLRGRPDFQQFVAKAKAVRPKGK
ncbi:MAG TPA: serine/threonine-protein kinase [Gemmataceae bacterium]|jgi:serine/threonine-protein kinase|nr:serine/threonine-protein kinase [Gemmataceae bacterium]